MNRPYIKSRNSIASLINHYYIALIPLIIYGLYKNIFLLYNKVSFGYLLKPFIILVLGLAVGLLIEFLYQKFYSKKPFKKCNKFTILNSLIIMMVLPVNCNYFMATIILFLSLSIIKFLKLENKFNEMALIILLLIGALHLFKLDSFANSYEASKNLSLTFINIFMGRSIGGSFITSNFWCLVSLFILCHTPVYKKEIPIYILVTTLILMVIFSLIKYDYNLWQLFFSGFTFFGAIFIAPDTLSSSYTAKGKIIYSILIAIINFILMYVFKIYYGIFIAIFLVSLASKIFDLKFVV